MKPGDRVIVDLSDMYLGFCHGCNTIGLMVPGGSCSLCHAREDRVEKLRDITEDDIDQPEVER